MSVGRLPILAVLLLGAIVRIPLLDHYHVEGLSRDASAYMSIAESFASGEGWINHSVRFLYELPARVPFPDSYWSPLFPFLLGVVFHVTGASFGAAQMVSLFFGLLVPPLAASLAFTLTRSRAAFWSAGLLAAVHPTLAMWSCRAQPEITSICLVTLTLWLLLREETRRKPILVGVAMGLAWLAKYQNGALLVPVAVYYLARAPRRWRSAALATAAFVATISPWLIRNTVLFGNPVHATVSTALISYYPEFQGEARFVTSLEKPPAPVPYILTHPRDAYALAHSSVRNLLLPFLRDQSGSVFLIPFAGLGVLISRRSGKRAAALLAFAAFLFAAFAVTTPIVRYVFVLVPVWIAFVAAGAAALFAAAAAAPAGRRWATAAATTAVLALGGSFSLRATVAGANARHDLWTPSANFGVLEALASAPYIREHTAADECVLAAETYHYARFLDRCAVQIPYDEATLHLLRERYRIRYLVTSLRDLRRHFPAWEESPPRWASLARRIPAAEIARPPANPDYPHVSEMRIYLLHAPESAAP